MVTPLIMAGVATTGNKLEDAKNKEENFQTVSQAFWFYVGLFLLQGLLLISQKLLSIQILPIVSFHCLDMRIYPKSNTISEEF